MSVEEVKDITGATMLVCKGTVTAVYTNEIPEDKLKTYKGSKPGTTFTPKFRPKIIVGDTHLGLGQRENDKINGKKQGGGDKDYVPVTVGAEVVCIVEKSEYNGKTYYNTAPSKIIVVKQGEAPQQGGNGGQQQQSYKPRDNSGVVAGNGFNAAKALLKGKPPKTAEDFITAANKLVDIGERLRSYQKQQDPSLDDYTVGARCGMVLIAAAEWCKTLDEVEDKAKELLDSYLIPIICHVKGEDCAAAQEDNEEAYDEESDLPF